MHALQSGGAHIVPPHWLIDTMVYGVRQDEDQYAVSVVVL
jgi:hypothetical protein